METAVTLGLPFGLAMLYVGTAAVALHTARRSAPARHHFWLLVGAGLGLQGGSQLAAVAHLPLAFTAAVELAGFALFSAALLGLLVRRRRLLGIRRFLDIVMFTTGVGLLGMAAASDWMPITSLHEARLFLAPVLALGLLSGVWVLAHDAPPDEVLLERRLVAVLIAALASTTTYLLAVGTGGTLPWLLTSYAAMAIALATLTVTAWQDPRRATLVELAPTKGPRLWLGAVLPDLLLLAVMATRVAWPDRLPLSAVAFAVLVYVVRHLARSQEAQEVHVALARESRQTAALLEVARAGSTERDLARVLDSAVQMLPVAVGFERAAVWLLDGGDELVLAAAAGYPPELSELVEQPNTEGDRRLRAALDFPGPVVHAGPLAGGEAGVRFGSRTCVLSPLPAPVGSIGGVLGVLLLSTSEDTVPDDGDLTAVHGVAQVLGQTVTNQRLVARLVDEQTRLRDLTEALLATQEQERIAVSNAIHDDAVQLLSATAIKIEALTLGSDGENDMPTALGTAAVQLRDASVRLRDLMARLRPPQLDQIGLAAALEAEAARWETESGIRILVAVEGTLPADKVADTVLFRTVQESLRNACRHSRASLITVRVAYRHGRLIGEIRDNGDGIPDGAVARALQNDHVGVQTMHEQVRLAGGTLQVDGKAKPGTLVTVTLPRAVTA